MSLNGFIVMDKGGVPIYSKVVDMDLQVDTALLSGFLTAIQCFAHEIDDKTSYIQELKMKNFNLMYREIELGTFLGIAGMRASYKVAEAALEHLILSFLSRYRSILISEKVNELNQFMPFDEEFLKYISFKKEKDIKKYFEKNTLNSDLLQGILNKLINYFPINELIKISPHLTIIGKKLIWVSFTISEDEKKAILEELKSKTAQIYGSGMFETLEQEVLKSI